ncbi:DinB family protein [Actinoplanes sp. NPDC051851]|uniref:mycothiol transferase n=1 Tax=Actinoplanes sp. NPDC051851 TaxID=3154753 RepID=UPI00342741B5
MDAKDILIDAYGRLPELVADAVRDLTPEQLLWAPKPGANTIGWLVWHLARVQDAQIAGITGGEQVYLTGDWAGRFGRKPDPADHGYGHSPADVAAVVPESREALIEYYHAVHAKTLEYLAGITEDELDRVVDRNWDPPVTAGVRLVSIYDDDAQHAAQAAYLRGLL